jgi:putative ABC transport system permease protein
MWRDLVHSWRMMCKTPVFALTAVLTLALGIGGNTAMFAVIHAVLLNPLPYREPDALVRISIDSPRRGVRDGLFSLTRYEQIRDTARSFTHFGAFNLENFALSGVAEPEQMRGARVSANFLHILGVEPALGRGFMPEEDASGAPAVTLLSDSLWRRRFGAQSRVVGTTVSLNATPHTIIGVLPAGFPFPSPEIDIWVTRVAQPSEPMPYQTPASAPYLIGFARLKPYVSQEQARAEMDLLNRSYTRAHPGYPDADPSAKVRFVGLQEQLVENIRPALWVLFGAVILVLLIACANVASLLLARVMTRSREFALRAALGAARTRLIRQLLLESLILALAGGMSGVLLSHWGLSVLTDAKAIPLPRAGQIRLDFSVLLFTLGISAGTSVLFGMLPALRVSRPDLARALCERGAVSGATRRGILGTTAHGLLVIGQVALSIVLLIGATLLLESFARLRRVELGFQPSDLLTMQLALPPSRYDTDRKKAVFFQDLVRRVEAVPGVRRATAAATLPAVDTMLFPIQIAGRPLVSNGERPRGRWQSVTPAYFKTLRIPMLRGREFNEHDNADAPWVVIINENMARRFWPEFPSGPDPVGQRLLFAGTSISAEIVGIAADVHEASLAGETGPEAYMPAAQRCLQTMYLIIRTDGDPRRFVNAVRSQVLAIDAGQPISHVRTMGEVLDASVGQHRFVLILLALFAGVALTLTILGIYGVIAYSVEQRTKEMGIRRALGAQQIDILRLVIYRGLVPALCGLGIGVGGAFALTRVLSGMLFHISATDPVTLTIVPCMVLVVALFACYVPARRAAKLDPMVALRCE